MIIHPTKHFLRLKSMTTTENNQGMLVLPLVLTDLKDRAAAGRERYGYDYRVNTRKDPLYEAYEEALDLVMYLRAEIERRNGG